MMIEWWLSPTKVVDSNRYLECQAMTAPWTVSGDAQIEMMRKQINSDYSRRVKSWVEKQMKNEIVDSNSSCRVRDSSSPGKEFDNIDDDERMKMKQMRPTMENRWVCGYS